MPKARPSIDIVDARGRSESRREDLNIRVSVAIIRRNLADEGPALVKAHRRARVIVVWWMECAVSSFRIQAKASFTFRI